MIERLHPGLDGRLGLAADIGLARRIMTDQHHRKPGHQTVLGCQLLHLFRDFDAQ